MYIKQRLGIAQKNLANKPKISLISRFAVSNQALGLLAYLKQFERYATYNILKESFKWLNVN